MFENIVTARGDAVTTPLFVWISAKNLPANDKKGDIGRSFSSACILPPNKNVGQ